MEAINYNLEQVKEALYLFQLIVLEQTEDEVEDAEELLDLACKVFDKEREEYLDYND